MLKLVETAEIVHLEANRFDDGWASIPASMKTRSESRAKVRKVWDMHAKRCGGQEALLGALRAYLKGDKDLPKSGGPGLQVWLRAEKYDHWIDGASCSVFAEIQTDGTQRVRFPDESIRIAVVASVGEGFARSYLDPCQWHEDGFITPKTTTAMEKLKDKASALKAAGIAGIRRKT